MPSVFSDHAPDLASKLALLSHSRRGAPSTIATISSGGVEVFSHFGVAPTLRRASPHAPLVESSWSRKAPCLSLSFSWSMAAHLPLVSKALNRYSKQRTERHSLTDEVMVNEENAAGTRTILNERPSTKALYSRNFWSVRHLGLIEFSR